MRTAVDNIRADLVPSALTLDEPALALAAREERRRRHRQPRLPA
jgi:hypothetical protein